MRSDAGEPSGTAGEPILGVLRHAGITDAAIVVVRWFGGVKLGTGGLGRAYRDAAAAALAAAPRLVVPLGRRWRLEFPYDLVGRIEHLLGACGGRRDAAEFGAGVVWTVWLPAARGEEFAREAASLGQGRVLVAPAGEPLIPRPPAFPNATRAFFGRGPRALVSSACSTRLPVALVRRMPSIARPLRRSCRACPGSRACTGRSSNCGSSRRPPP
ncbi:MAG: YigZ family protein [bacterium]|nr:YigZ family protein [bacterium]